MTIVSKQNVSQVAGINIQYAHTLEEVMQQGGLDWTVSKRPLCTSYVPVTNVDDSRRPTRMNKYGSTTMSTRQELSQAVRGGDIVKAQALIEELENPEHLVLPVNDNYAVVRNDHNIPLGVVGRGYKTMQNHECLEIIEDLIKRRVLDVKKVIPFDWGSRIYVQSYMNDDLIIAGERVEQHVNIYWSHDGSWKFQASFFYLFKHDSTYMNPKISNVPNYIGIRHTLNSDKKLSQSENILTKQYKHGDAFKNIANKMVDKPMDKDSFNKVLDKMFPTKDSKKNEQIQQTIEENASQQRNEIKNTTWGALMAISEYADNQTMTRVHGKDNMTQTEAEQAKQNNRFLSVVSSSGTANKIKNDAWKQLIKEVI